MAATATSTSSAEVIGAVGDQPLGLGAVGDDRVHRVRRHESDRALRPGPPKACSNCCRISLEPLAAQRFSTPTSTPVCAPGTRPGRCAAPPRRGPGTGAARRDAPDRRPRRRSRAVGGCGFSLVLSRTGTASCGAPYGDLPRRSSRSGRSPASALAPGCPSLSNLRRTASPWAGRFSALARVITWPETSFSAASCSRRRGCRAGTSAPTARWSAARSPRWAARGWTRRSSRRG